MRPHDMKETSFLTPSSPFIADHWGRKIAIAGGCVIMIAGAAVQGAAKSLTSGSSKLHT
jgi:hypothetical protein